MESAFLKKILVQAWFMKRRSAIPDAYKDALLAANSVQSAASQDGSVPCTLPAAFDGGRAENAGSSLLLTRQK